MKITTIAVTNLPGRKGVIELKKSLIKHNIPNEIIITPWQGFFTKVDQAYKYCQQTGSDYILFIDAHDVIFVGGMDSIIEYIEENEFPEAIFSSEKACWPDSSLSDKYPTCDSEWKYLNSGTYLMRPKKLIEVVESNMPEIGIDDQFYWTKHFLNDQSSFLLDTNCEIFQTLAHDNGESFGMVDGKFTNLVTKTNPVIVHGNGRSMEEFDYKYLSE